MKACGIGHVEPATAIGISMTAALVIVGACTGLIGTLLFISCTFFLTSVSIAMVIDDGMRSAKKRAVNVGIKTM
jgi:hypothetical protein